MAKDPGHGLHKDSKSLLKMSLNRKSIICLEEFPKSCTEGNVRQENKDTRTNEHSQHRACLIEHGHVLSFIQQRILSQAPF